MFPKALIVTYAQIFALLTLYLAQKLHFQGLESVLGDSVGTQKSFRM